MCTTYLLYRKESIEAKKKKRNIYATEWGTSGYQANEIMPIMHRKKRISDKKNAGDQQREVVRKQNAS